MKLHTKDQAPKEGGKEASQHPMQQVSVLLQAIAIKSCTCHTQSDLIEREPLHISRFLSGMVQWQPTRQGYLNFLAESKQVYDTLERLVKEAPQEECEYKSLILPTFAALQRA